MNVDAEFRAWLDKLDGGWILAVEAAKFTASARETDPKGFAEWLDENAEQFVTWRGASYERHNRAQAVARMNARRFHEAVSNASADEVRDIFAVTFVVGAQDERKRLGAMTAADHNFVADGYERDGKRALMFAAFHRALAKKVGSQRTDAVMTAEKVETLFSSITGKASA